VPAVGYVFVERDRVGIDRDKLAALNLPLASPVYRYARAHGSFTIEGREVHWQQVLSTRKGKRIVYSGDTAVCENLEASAHEADLLVQDCTYFETIEDVYGHACLNEVLAMARRASVKQVVLTHISRRYGSHEDLCALVSKHPHVSVAHDFMRVVL
jgi:ribonuclease Z